MARDYKEGLKDYIGVNERILAFYEKYPDGSLQAEILQLTDKLVMMKARAYRTPDDKTPGIGHSSLEIPGSTPYTRGSELENAETSAWGRALAALGFEVKRGIATSNEIANKQAQTSGSFDNDKPLQVVEGNYERWPATPPPETRPSCPKCGNVVGFLRDKKGNGWFCWKKREGCGANYTDSEYENARTKPDDKDIDWDPPPVKYGDYSEELDTSTSQDGPPAAGNKASASSFDESLPPPTPAPKGRQKAALSIEQIDQLLRACESAGVEVPTMLSWFSAKAVEDLTLSQHVLAMKTLIEHRTKAAAELLR